MEAVTFAITKIHEVEISADEDSLINRDDLLDLSRTVSRVTNAAEATHAAGVLKDLKAFARSTENARTAAKAPVLKLGQRIDELARNVVDEINRRAEEIDRELGRYTAEQKRIAEEERRLAWERQEAERKRIEAEEAEKTRKEAEERERLRLEAEAKALEEEERAANLKTKAAREKALAEAARIREQAEKDAAELQKQQNEAALERQAVQADQLVAAAGSVPQVATKIAGIATRGELKFKVTNIVSLYESHPFLVKMEPNTAALKAAIKQLAEGQQIPGVEFWYEARVSVR